MDSRSHPPRPVSWGFPQTQESSSDHIPPGATLETWIHYNDLGNTRALSLSGLHRFASRAAFSTTNNIRTWSCSPRLDVTIGLGSGQNASPFSMTEAQFKETCQEMEFSEPFLQKLVSRASMFEHRFVFSGSSTSTERPTHLEIGMSVFEIDSYFRLLRYDISEASVKCLLFLKPLDYLKTKLLNPEDMVRWLDTKWDILGRHPLLIANMILDFMQLRAHEYLRWRLELYNMESRLGVTRNGQLLLMRGYEDVSYDFGLLNADLAGIAKQVADTELSASTMLEQAKSLQRLVKICEECKAVSNQDQTQPQSMSPVSEMHEEIQATITRAELYLTHTKMAQDVLQSLTSVLYNRINKQGTDAMKTIAVVTLVFLPATFVSAVFSTGIFNFHASEASEHPKTVSKYGCVYLLVCILSTALTILSWICWYRWGRHWLEKLEFARMQRSGRQATYFKQPPSMAPLAQYAFPGVPGAASAAHIASSSNTMPGIQRRSSNLEQPATTKPSPEEKFPVAMKFNVENNFAISQASQYNAPMGLNDFAILK